MLDTPEKINAFNDSKKFSCYVIGGDWVSDLKKSNLFQNNINYVKNNNSLKHNIMSEHAVESASFNEFGKFNITSREKAFKGHKHTVQRMITYAMASFGRIAKAMYESSSAILDKFFSSKTEVQALPKATSSQIKPNNIRENYKLENFVTMDQNYDRNQAKINLSSTRSFENDDRVKQEDKDFEY